MGSCCSSGPPRKQNSSAVYSTSKPSIKEENRTANADSTASKGVDKSLNSIEKEELTVVESVPTEQRLVVQATTDIGGENKKENQDTFNYAHNYQGEKGQFVCCVLDGHGQHGKLLADFCCGWLMQSAGMFLQQGGASKKTEDILTDLFLGCEKAIQTSADIGFRSQLSGTTASFCIVLGNTLFYAFVGDSRGFIGTINDNGHINATPLGEDHRPERSDEAERIHSKGGVIGPSGYSSNTSATNAPLRVWLPLEEQKRLGLNSPAPGLMLTRSLGDGLAKAAGCTAKPEVVKHVLNEKDQFLVMASDGIWDMLSEVEVIELISQKLYDPSFSPATGQEELSQILVQAAKTKWKNKNRADNITALVLLF